MLPWAGSTSTPTSATTNAKITRQRCDRLTCKPDRRCAEHRAGGQPVPVGVVIAELMQRWGGGSR